jgi:hypothetical protein
MATNSLEYGRQWRNKNRQTIKAYHNKWKKEHPEQYAARISSWKKKNKSKLKFYQITNKYRITKEQYEAMLTHQNFRCGACEIDLKSISATEVHVDHCHKSKLVRAILCGSCNRALGLMNDDAKRLQKLAKYAAKFN